MLSRLICICGILAGGVAAADPGDLFADPERVAVLPEPHICAAAVRGQICLRPGAPTTLAVAPALAMLETAQTAFAPSFGRAVVLAANGRPRSLAEDEQAWTIAVDARLRRRAWAGNALFVVYDGEDPSAVERHEVTALWQAPIAASDQLSAVLTLSPQDGFHAQHLYRLRIVQLINGKEMLLADGPLFLR